MLLCEHVTLVLSSSVLVQIWYQECEKYKTVHYFPSNTSWYAALPPDLPGTGMIVFCVI